MVGVQILGEAGNDSRERTDCQIAGRMSVGKGSELTAILESLIPVIEKKADGSHSHHTTTPLVVVQGLFNRSEPAALEGREACISRCTSDVQFRHVDEPSVSLSLFGALEFVGSAGLTLCHEPA
jgi:hypothetical protein